MVVLKRGEASVGAYPYDEILGVLRTELDDVIATKSPAQYRSRRPSRSGAPGSYGRSRKAPAEAWLWLSRSHARDCQSPTQ